MDNLKNLAIIPARSGSKRIPKKNIKDFLGKPIIEYTIKHAIDSGVFDEIHISTDSEEIANCGKKFDLVPNFLRKKNISLDNSSLNDVIKFVLEKFNNQKKKFENICLLWATNPLRKPEDIIDSLKLLNSGKMNAVVAVSGYDLPVQCSMIQKKNNYLKPLFPKDFWKTSSEFPKVFCDIGSLAWVKTKAFNKYENWFPPKTSPFYIEKERAVDIDNLNDWKLAEYYFKKK